MDAFSSAVTFGNITLAHSMPSGGGIHSISSQRQSTEGAFVGKVAVVIEGTSDIDAAAARFFADRGAKVHALGLGAASAGFDEASGVVPIELDVTDDTALPVDGGYLTM